MQVQQCIEFLINEAIRRGAHPDDRDSLTDMTLLMYACKAGANGVGDAQSAARVRPIFGNCSDKTTLYLVKHGTEKIASSLCKNSQTL